MFVISLGAIAASLIAVSSANASASSGKKSVLILGDSTTMRYTPILKKIYPEVDIVRPAGNHQGTVIALKNIEEWLGKGDWDVIHFNFGLHDFKHIDPETGKGSSNQEHPFWAPPEQYRKNLETIVERLKETGAILIFATTTPVPQDERYGTHDKHMSPVYNKIALEIMRENDVVINDLYTYTLPNLAEWQIKRDVHFNKLGSTKVAEKVREAIKTLLAKSEPTVEVKDGVIQFFADNIENGVIGSEQINDVQQLWVSGVRKNGKTRQVRINSYIVKGRGERLIRFYYPFGDASATWNMDVKRDGDIVSVMMPFNGILVGDIMDVNEGADEAVKARKRLGLTEPDSTLPVMYSSGDSISKGYWPYLEAELYDKVNVYYQRELAKDIPDVGLRNNGIAGSAYGVLQKAYKNQEFKPDYWLVNFGLHMINSYKNNLPAYGKWVEKFIAYAEEKQVNLIFVNTTPYQQSFRPEQNLTILKFNELMKVAAEKHDVPVVDLHACTLAAVKDLGEKKVYVDGVHFTEDMKKRQAAHIAERVRDIVTRGE